MALARVVVPITVVHGLVQPDGLPITCVLQGRTQWCWAACSEMVLRFNGRQIDKCTVASWLLSPRDCCPSGQCNEPCHVINGVDDVAKIYHHYGLNATHRLDRVLQPGELKG